MRQLIRQPLTWMVAGEVLVVAALVGVCWHLLAGQPIAPNLPALILPSSSPPAADAEASMPADGLAPPRPSAVPLLPGLNVDPMFWRKRLDALNRAEAEFEGLEWRIVRSAMDSMQRYIETVVLPSVQRAESGDRKM